MIHELEQLKKSENSSGCVIASLGWKNMCLVYEFNLRVDRVQVKIPTRIETLFDATL